MIRASAGEVDVVKYITKVHPLALAYVWATLSEYRVFISQDLCRETHRFILPLPDFRYPVSLYVLPEIKLKLELLVTRILPTVPPVRVTCMDPPEKLPETL